MATRRSPWTRAILEVLADGQWHDRAELVDVARPAVPPGRAYRNGERNRARMHALRSDTALAERTRGDRQSSIDTGAHLIVVEALRGLARRSVIERDGDRYRSTQGR